MTIYAIIEDGTVRQLLETDLDISEVLHPDVIAVDLAGVKPMPSEGWSATEAKGSWSFSKPKIPEPSDEQLKSAAIAKRDGLIAEANEATIGMTDAFVAGLLEPEDEAMFKAWAAYKLKLNKIDKQLNYPKDVAWPDKPDLE